MLTFAIDTALNACSLAILGPGGRGADKFLTKFLAMSQGHAEHLAPLAAALFTEAGVRAQDLDRIAVVSGPGQFAGVRIGLAFALGLALGGRAEVLGVSSLAAFAAGLEEAPESLRAAIVDARRGEVYAALYAPDGAIITPPFLAAEAEAAGRLKAAAGKRPVTLTGNGAAQLAPFAPEWPAAPREHIDINALARFAQTAEAAHFPPTPIYLRAPDAAPAKPGPFGARA